MTTEPVTAVQPSLGRLGPTSGPGGQAARAVLRRLEIARRYGLPRRFLSSRFAPCGAGRLALEQVPQRELHGLRRTPNVCTRMSSQFQNLSTVPLHRLDAVMCTGPWPSTGSLRPTATWQPSGAAPVAGGATASHGPSAWRSGPGLCPWPGAAWWAGRCSSRRCRRSPTRSYHSAENACRRPAMPRRRCRVVRQTMVFWHFPEAG